MKPGAAGSWDRDAFHALRYAAYGYARPTLTGRRQRLVPPYRYGSDILVTEAQSHHPYGRSTHGAAYLTHVVDGLYLAWTKGWVRLTMARWRCGLTTNHFRLVSEPDSTLCPVCLMERVPRERRIRS